MSLTKITSHQAEALSRLLDQYKGKTNVESLVAAFTIKKQDLEDALWDLLQNRWLATAVGAQLDTLGEIVAQPRGGLVDGDYRTRLLAKIATNVSKGTPEDLLRIFKLIMGATLTEITEIYPAKVRLIAAGYNLIGTVDQMKAALNAARPGGVEIEYFATSGGSPAFGFDGDPTAATFGDATNATVGGYFVGLI